MSVAAKLRLFLWVRSTPTSPPWSTFRTRTSLHRAFPSFWFEPGKTCTSFWCIPKALRSFDGPAHRPCETACNPRPVVGPRQTPTSLVAPCWWTNVCNRVQNCARTYSPGSSKCWSFHSRFSSACARPGPIPHSLSQKSQDPWSNCSAPANINSHKYFIE